MNNNPLVLFLLETIKRLAVKSPKFFAIWQWILGLLASLTGFPALLRSIKVIHSLPPFLEALSNADVAFAALGGLAVAFLTSQSKPVAVTKEGEIIKKTDQTALPFTAVHETKIATKEGNNQTSDLT